MEIQLEMLQKRGVTFQRRLESVLYWLVFEKMLLEEMIQQKEVLELQAEQWFEQLFLLLNVISVSTEAVISKEEELELLFQYYYWMA